MGKWLRSIFEGHKGEMKGGGEMAKDPICGMEVDVKKAAATSVHQGQTYYFCSVGCKKTFDQNPAKYTEGGGQEMTGHGGHLV